MLKSTLRLASRSRFGVLTYGLLTPPMERGAWSSAMMNRTLGLPAQAVKGPARKRQRSKRVICRKIFYQSSVRKGEAAMPSLL